MPIYVGSNKTAPSGVAKVYCGSNLVYQKSSPPIPSTCYVTLANDNGSYDFYIECGGQRVGIGPLHQTSDTIANPFTAKETNSQIDSFRYNGAQIPGTPIYTASGTKLWATTEWDDGGYKEVLHVEAKSSVTLRANKETLAGWTVNVIA